MIHYFKSKTEICKRFRFLFLALALSTLFYACLPVKKNIVRPSINDLGIQIKKHRIKRGYTVKQLAKAVKISEQNLRLIEQGQATPIYHKLIAIQEFLDAEFVLSR